MEWAELIDNAGDDARGLWTLVARLYLSNWSDGEINPKQASTATRIQVMRMGDDDTVPVGRRTQFDDDDDDDADKTDSAEGLGGKQTNRRDTT